MELIRSSYLGNSFIDKIFIYYNHDYESHCDYDIFACGPDFGERPEQQEHLDWCSKNNVDILRVPRTEGISTSEIINRILSKENY